MSDLRMIHSRADCDRVSLRKRKMKGNMQSLSRFFKTCSGVGMIEQWGIKDWGTAGVALSMIMNRGSRVEVEVEI